MQPRSRKISSKIGIGIPRSHRRMYPVAPACLILFLKYISNLSTLLILELLVVHLNLFYLLKDTIGRMNDFLVRKNPMLHKEFLVHDSEIAQAAGNIAKRLKGGTPIGYISMLFVVAVLSCY